MVDGNIRVVRGGVSDSSGVQERQIGNSRVVDWECKNVWRGVQERLEKSAIVADQECKRDIRSAREADQEC